LRRVGEFGANQFLGFGFSPARDCAGWQLTSDDPVPPDVSAQAAQEEGTAQEGELAAPSKTISR
jgi:hypothetical protein